MFGFSFSVSCGWKMTDFSTLFCRDHLPQYYLCVCDGVPGVAHCTPLWGSTKVDLHISTTTKNSTTKRSLTTEVCNIPWKTTVRKARKHAGALKVVKKKVLCPKPLFCTVNANGYNTMQTLSVNIVFCHVKIIP